MAACDPRASVALHPQHALARRQMDGFGGIISRDLHTHLPGARRFLEHCEIFALAESLGGVKSLTAHPAPMTHASIPLDNASDWALANV